MQRDANGRVWRCRAGGDCGAGRQPARTLVRCVLGWILGSGHGRLMHPTASLKYLWKLRQRARSKVDNDRRGAAGDPHSSPRLLNRLARDRVQPVRYTAGTSRCAHIPGKPPRGDTARTAATHGGRVRGMLRRCRLTETCTSANHRSGGVCGGCGPRTAPAER